MTGIYCIKDLINQRCYIGQSVDIAHRWKQHRIASSYLNLARRKSEIKSYSDEDWDKL